MKYFETDFKGRIFNFLDLQKKYLYYEYIINPWEKYKHYNAKDYLALFWNDYNYLQNKINGKYTHYRVACQNLDIKYLYSYFLQVLGIN